MGNVCGEEPGFRLLEAKHMEQDPAAEETHGSGYPDGGMVNKCHFHSELGVRASDGSHKDLLLARENSPERFLRSSSDPEREKARA